MPVFPCFFQRKTHGTEMFADENLFFRKVFFSRAFGDWKCSFKHFLKTNGPEPFVFEKGAFSGGVILLTSSCVQPSLLKKPLPQITNQPWFLTPCNQFHIPKNPTIFAKKKHQVFPLNKPAIFLFHKPQQGSVRGSFHQRVSGFRCTTGASVFHFWSCAKRSRAPSHVSNGEVVKKHPQKRLVRYKWGVSLNGGFPPKWMGLMENPIKMDDLGVPLFFGNIQIPLIQTTGLFGYILKQGPGTVTSYGWTCRKGHQEFVGFRWWDRRSLRKLSF